MATGRILRSATILLAVAAIFLASLASGALAIDPSERLDDPVLEARARALSAELRCLVCQNQSIDDSDALLARDLRTLVRERLSAGESDAEIIDFVVARYGEFVLLRPPFNARTLLLWLAPLLILLGVSGYIGYRLFSQRSQMPRAGALEAIKPLTQAERDRLSALVGGQSQPADGTHQRH
ncbi:MAG: cytochrome c-type biogenesis protein [Hyphomicrobiaceae bacterium]